MLRFPSSSRARVYLYERLSYPLVCTEYFEYKIKLLCSTRAKQSCMAARRGCDGSVLARLRAVPPAAAGRARAGGSPACPRPPAPLVAAVTCRAVPPRSRPPSLPPPGLCAGSGRGRSMSTLKVYSTSVTGSREVRGCAVRLGKARAARGPLRRAGVPSDGETTLPAPPHSGVLSLLSRRVSPGAPSPPALLAAPCCVPLPHGGPPARCSLMC